jgi:hypothetical protein
MHTAQNLRHMHLLVETFYSAKDNNFSCSLLSYSVAEPILRAKSDSRDYCHYHYTDPMPAFHNGFLELFRLPKLFELNRHNGLGFGENETSRRLLMSTFTDSYLNHVVYFSYKTLKHASSTEPYVPSGDFRILLEF